MPDFWLYRTHNSGGALNSAQRNTPPPDDTVVVIRGGNMMLESLRKSAEASFRETGLYLISVFLVEEQELEVV
ncbi:MAG: hypothetical protein ACKO80_07865, partial [Acidimicrobiaceae bacterium]